MGKVVVLGGSGIHDSPSFEDLEWKVINTGLSNGHGDGAIYYQERDDGVIFIPRHGHGDARYGPSITQYKANLLAAKMLGASVVIATSAVGSLRPDEISVGNLVVPDDYIDETGRDDNMFGTGIVVHTNPRPAFSEGLRQILLETAQEGDYFNGVINGGTYVTIPGDRFGTTAEGLKRAAYAHIVGMTACPEASIAMQLGLHYAVAAFPVDIDTDANHESGTLAVMRELSKPHRVPAYIEKVIERAKVFAENEPLLLQLQGNIIPGDIKRISNPNLRRIAQELVSQY